jgi:hypothetical protein
MVLISATAPTFCKLYKVPSFNEMSCTSSSMFYGYIEMDTKKTTSYYDSTKQRETIEVFMVYLNKVSA